MKEYLECWRKYAVFSGMETRHAFWMFVWYDFLISTSIVIWTILATIIGLVFNVRDSITFLTLAIGGGVFALYRIASLVPSLAVCVRRIRCKGHSAWWLPLDWFFILWAITAVLLVLAVLAAFGGSPRKNQMRRRNQMKVSADQMIGKTSYGVSIEADYECKYRGFQFARERGERSYEVYSDMIGDLSSYAFSKEMIFGGKALDSRNVRLDHFVNAFDYGYTEPKDGETFSVSAYLGANPWKKDAALLQIGVVAGGADLKSCRAKKNVVLIVSAFRRAELSLRNREMIRSISTVLSHADRLSVVMCGQEPSVLLSSNARVRSEEIYTALVCGLSTNGRFSERAVRMACGELEEMFDPSAINSVMVLVDNGLILPKIEEDKVLGFLGAERWSSVRFSLLSLGFRYGMERFEDAILRTAHGQAYRFLERPSQVAHAIQCEMTREKCIAAEDVTCSVLVETNATVAVRQLSEKGCERFARFGAGRAKTLLYEISCPEQRISSLSVPVQIRWREPDAGTCREKVVEALWVDGSGRSRLKTNFDFCSAVAESALLLKDDSTKEALCWHGVIERSKGLLGEDPAGEKTEFARMARCAERMSVGRR